MNKDEFMRSLKNFLESEEIMNQFNLTRAPLLKSEIENLHREETNWQSFVLSSLMKLLIIREEFYLLYHWRVKGLEPVKEVYRYFCSQKAWVDKDKNWCINEGKCWENEQAEFDAVIKDRNGNWQAIFEFEDDYNTCCQELCHLLQVIKWLRKYQSIRLAPIIYLFYWIPYKPPRKFQESIKNLEIYKRFILDNFYKDFHGTRFVLVLQSGSDEPPYVIIKTRVVSDEKDFRNLTNVIKREFKSLI